MANTLTICGVEYAVGFDRGSPGAEPLLILTTLTGSPTSYRGWLDCSGCDYLVFAFGDPAICTGTRDGNCGCSNIVRVKVACSCCVMDGWDGEGWYCVVAAGGDCADATVLELLESDKCAGGITICSGPYADEATALENCSAGTPVTTVCCPDDAIPQTLSVVFGGDLAAFGTQLFNYVPRIPPSTIDSWASVLGGPTGCGLTGTISLICDGPDWRLTAPGTDTTFSVTASATCNPFSISFSGTATGDCAGAFTATVSVT